MNRSDIEFGAASRGLAHGNPWDNRARDLVLDMAAPGSVGPGQEMELVRLLRIAWSHKFLIAAITIVCAALGLGIAALQTPMYRSHATVELLGINQNFLNLREVDPHASSSGESAGDAYISTEIELLRSEGLVKKVVEKLGLASHANRQAGSGASVKAVFHLGGHPVVSTNALVQRALANLQVEQVKASNLLEITYTDPDPKTAADFVNTLIEEAIRTNSDDRWNLSERVGALLNRQVQLLQQRMEKAANELQTYSRESGLVFTDEKNNMADAHLSELETELAQAQNDRIQRESQYKLAKAADPETLPQVLDNGPLREYSMRLADLNREYADLLATRTPKNVKVIQVKAQIDALKATMERERTNILDRIANEYNTAKQREAMLTAAYQQQASVVSDQSAKAIRYNTLKREVDTTRDLYETMLRRVNDAEMVSAIRASDIRLVDSALPPAAPRTPNKPLLAGIGMVSGLLIGLTAVFVKEQRNRTIQQPGYSSSLLNLTELGVIPSARPAGPRLIPAGPRAATDAVLPYTSRGSALNTYSLLKDSFRGVVNSILFAESENDSLQVLIISSPHAREGKTTSVCNLGVAFAEIGRRVLLMDADFRRPRLHEVFKVSNDSGLLDALSDGEKNRSELDSLIRSTAVPGLSVLTVGSTSAPLPTLLHSDRLSRLLGKLRSQYDLILIDSAPLLIVPESRILAKSTDGIVLVIRAGVTTPGVALAARRRALEDRTPLIGTILNDWKPDMAQYYSYYADRSA
ncbi:MAG: polysaccharide biosynthesis tyrosine autokinase [Bryobacteraceae bacterium]